MEEAASGLAPNDATDALAGAIAGWSDDTMVVGHLPFLGRLASRLVAGSEEANVAAFQPGTVACLERADDGEDGGGWTLAWMVRPELLGG